MNMSPKFERELDELGLIIDGLFPGLENLPTDKKAEILEHLLWLFRVSRKKTSNTVSYEEVVESKFLVVDEQINISLPVETIIDAGFRPIQYQPALLWHLLLNGHKEEAVLDTIRGFIYRHYSSLQLADFKKTDTGVIRCFTNTRFAANTLREHGFLRYGWGDAFKHWKLTFPGLMAAGHFYLHPPKNIPSIYNWHGLYPDFHGVIKRFMDYENCIDILSKLFNKSEGSFSSYEPMLRAFCNNARIYHDELSDVATKKDGRVVTRKWVQYIDSISDKLGFADEFALDMQLSKFEADWFHA